MKVSLLDHITMYLENVRVGNAKLGNLEFQLEKEVLVGLGVLLASEFLPETHSHALKSESGPRS